jgi:hypothetical protein
MAEYTECYFLYVFIVFEVFGTEFSLPDRAVYGGYLRLLCVESGSTTNGIGFLRILFID